MAHCRLIHIAETHETVIEMVEWNGDVGAHTYLCESYHRKDGWYTVRTIWNDMPFEERKELPIYRSYEQYWQHAATAGLVTTKALMLSLIHI